MGNLSRVGALAIIDRMNSAWTRFLLLAIRHKGKIDRVCARVTSWAIAIAVAFFPAIVSAASRISPNLFGMADAINSKYRFHEFYFAGMVISVFSLSNLWDSFSVWERVPEAEDKRLLWRLFARLTYAFFIIVLFYGVWEYVNIKEIRVPEDELNRLVWLMIVILIVSLGTEIMIALAEAGGPQPKKPVKTETPPSGLPKEGL